MKTPTRPDHRRLGAAAILPLLLWFCPPPAGAQVNTERLRIDRDTAGWSGSADARVMMRTGSVSLVLVRLGGRVDLTGTHASTFLVANGDLGWEGGERFSNQALVHLRGQRPVSDWLTPEAFVQYDYNKARLLNGRFLVGVGGRFSLLARPRFHLTYGTGYMLEREWYDLPPSAVHPRRETAHRWNNYLSGNFRPTPRVGFVVTAYAQPRLDRFSDLRLLADARLGVTLAGPVVLTLTWNGRYDSRPPDGEVMLDTTLEGGIAVEW